MLRLLFILLAAIQLAACQTTTPPAQDDLALRHKIASDIQNYALENATTEIEQFEKKYPNNAELPALKTALGERFLDQTWKQLAKVSGELKTINKENQPHYSELVILLNQAQQWGANSTRLAEINAEISKRFSLSTQVSAAEDKAAIVNINAKAPANLSAAPVKLPKKAKSKAEKSSLSKSDQEPVTEASIKDAPIDAPKLEQAENAATPARREIKLNQADVEARSDIVAEMLKQVSKHIISEPVNVVIQSRSMKDFRWINALLKTSVQEIDPAFNLSSEPVVDPAAAPAVVLILR